MFSLLIRVTNFILEQHIIFCHILFGSIPSEVPQKLPLWTVLRVNGPKGYQHRFFLTPKKVGRALIFSTKEEMASTIAKHLVTNYCIDCLRQGGVRHFLQSINNGVWWETVRSINNTDRYQTCPCSNARTFRTSFKMIPRCTRNLFLPCQDQLKVAP